MLLVLQTVSGKKTETKALDDFCQDLCEQARKKATDPVREIPAPVTTFPFACLLHRPLHVKTWACIGDLKRCKLQWQTPKLNCLLSPAQRMDMHRCAPVACLSDSGMLCR